MGGAYSESAYMDENWAIVRESSPILLITLWKGQQHDQLSIGQPLDGQTMKIVSSQQSQDSQHSQYSQDRHLSQHSQHSNYSKHSQYIQHSQQSQHSQYM